MVVNLRMIAYHLELEMVPADYELKVNPIPKLKPDKRFQVPGRPAPAPGRIVRLSRRWMRSTLCVAGA